MIELKPCPFCGLEPDMSDGDTIYPSGTAWKDEGEYRSYHSFREVSKEQWCYSVHCVTIAGGCGAEVSGDSREEAISKWNTRTLNDRHRIVTVEFLEGLVVIMRDAIQSSTIEKSMLSEGIVKLVEEIIEDKT